MARIKARERSAWQDDPNWKPLAPYEYKHNLTVEPKGVERHRLRMADHNFVRQPSIEKAEQAANSCLLMGLHLPVDPMQLLIRLPRVQTRMPIAFACSTSRSSRPPSGPVSRLTVW